MMKMDREIPVDLSCDFQPKNSTVPVVWVRIQHGTPDGENSIVWEGNSTDDTNTTIEKETKIPSIGIVTTMITIAIVTSAKRRN